MDSGSGAGMTSNSRAGLTYRSSLRAPTRNPFLRLPSLSPTKGEKEREGFVGFEVKLKTGN